MDDCIFCKIVRGELPAYKVYEDDTTLAFLDINPVNPGHTLVIPKEHMADVFDMSGDSWNAVMHTARVVANAINASLSPSGINLGMNNKKGAGQIVFHAHVHVMPRFDSDTHELWKGHPYQEGEAVPIAKKIRAAL